jgi:polysaccharide pyruvyl transferase CsaB
VKVVVAAWIGAGNVGDELLFMALRHELVRLGLEPVALSLDPTATRSLHDVPAVMHTSVWAALGQSSGLVFGGGGLAQDRTSGLSPIYQFARPWLASRRGRSIVAVGLGAEPLRHRSSALVIRNGLAGAEAVVARDAASAGVLSAAGVPDVIRGADLAFLLDPLPAPPDVQDRLVVSLAPPVGSGGSVPSWLRRGVQQPAIDRVAASIAPHLDRLALVSDSTVRFVAMDPQRDAALHLAVADRLTCDVEVAHATLGSVRAEFAAARVVIAARYHACVAAALAGRPLVALSYAPKVAALVSATDAPAVALPYDGQGVRHLATEGERLLRLASGWPGLIDLRAAAELNRRALERFAERAATSMW